MLQKSFIYLFYTFGKYLKKSFWPAVVVAVAILVIRVLVFDVVRLGLLQANGPRS